MRILYVAIDQTVPGTTGGSTHVAGVAEGLAARGHEMHVLVAPSVSDTFPTGSVHWHPLAPPFRRRQLRLFRAAAVRGLAQRIRPQVVIERYYNFGGEGALAARALRVPLVLEVNAPVVDYPGSPKRTLDRALIVEPMRRWREWLCERAALLVTPSASIVPPAVPRSRILEIEWGADTTRFRPGALGEPPFTRRPGQIVAVFAGAFRTWHGAIHLVEAVRRLRARGRLDIVAVLIGDGPELRRVREAAAGIDGIEMTGALSYARMPAALAAADIGVAPFDVAAHAPLALDFYWSPLKIFEYMASGLPVVAPTIPRLQRMVSDGEGVLYSASDANGLPSALERLADDPARRHALGAAGRERVMREFSWDVHCRHLDEALRQCVS